MIDFLQELLGPFFLYIKFFHVLAVMAWIWSATVAYAYYLVPVFKAWRRNPDDPRTIDIRNWVMERFDHGVIYEHIAFPVIIITGPLLYIAGGYDTGTNWLLLKLIIVSGIFIPIEICDYYISHMGGRKRFFRKEGGDDAYEQAVQIHWWFFLITSAPIMVFAILTVFLAITKPF